MLFLWSHLWTFSFLLQKFLLTPVTVQLFLPHPWDLLHHVVRRYLDVVFVYCFITTWIAAVSTEIRQVLAFAVGIVFLQTLQGIFIADTEDMNNRCPCSSRFRDSTNPDRRAPLELLSFFVGTAVVVSLKVPFLHKENMNKKNFLQFVCQSPCQAQSNGPNLNNFVSCSPIVLFVLIVLITRNDWRSTFICRRVLPLSWGEGA